MPKAKPGTASLPDSDYLLDIAQKRWPAILKIYMQFKDKKPIMLYDIQEQRIYAYPYTEFRDDMSEKSQRSLTEQYETAVRETRWCFSSVTMNGGDW